MRFKYLEGGGPRLEVKVRVPGLIHPAVFLIRGYVRYGTRKPFVMSTYQEGLWTMSLIRIFHQTRIHKLLRLFRKRRAQSRCRLAHNLMHELNNAHRRHPIRIKRRILAHPLARALAHPLLLSLVKRKRGIAVRGCFVFEVGGEVVEVRVVVGALFAERV